MSTASYIARSERGWGPLVALCVALLIAAAAAGPASAQRGADTDTTKKEVVTSISISADGIVITGKTSDDAPDSVTIMDLDIERLTARAEAKARALEERLRDLEIVDYDTEGHDIVRFGEDIYIRENKRVRGSVVAIGGSIIIEGQVVGDVVAVGGNVALERGSSVTGDAVSVGGSLMLEGGSSVRGDAVSVGGKVDQNEDSYVAGDTISVGFVPSFFFKGLGSPFAFAAMDITGLAVKTLIMLLLVWAAVAIFPDRVRRMVDYSGSNIWLSALVGFGVLIALPVVVILLIVTLIGIPLAIILPLAFALASIVAYAAGAGLLGYRFGSRLVSKAPAELSMAQAAIIGVLIVGAVRIAGRLLGMGGSILLPLSIALGAAAILAGLFIYFVGLGSLLLTRFGAQPKSGFVPAGAPAPGPALNSPREGEGQAGPSTEGGPQTIPPPQG